MKTFRAEMVLGKLILASLPMLGACLAVAQESVSAWPPAATTSAGGAGAMEPLPPPSPYGAAWPPPGQDARSSNAGRQDWNAAQQSSPAAQQSLPAAMQDQAAVPIVTGPPRVEQLITSTWYFRQEAFYWNERVDGRDFVNERGPLSTLGYVRRNNFERFRMELFGGSVAYDGGAQYEDGTYEAYHQSNGTNYLGVRGEYDLLIEPASWPRVRLFAGVGTRFWIRDLHDAVTPSGGEVWGYQESWWTFYPYIGVETREPDEPGWSFFGSARFGLTPLTYQHVSYYDVALYPRCGVTAQAELGVRFQKVSVSAYLEAMTWGESAVVRDCLQPESRMFTVGGKLSYTF
jgi:hypothetical protein